MNPNSPAARLLFVALFPLALPVAAFADATDHALTDQLAADAAALAPAFVAPAAPPADPTGAGSWGSIITWTPHIPVTAATLPDGRLLTFASNQRTTFPGGVEFTYAAVWNPATGQFTEINNNRHDMFCGGASMLPDGRVVINGGRNTTVLSSIFDYRTNQWSAIQNMNDPRWYNTSVALTDGSVFTVSGSGGSNTAERWDAASGWRRLTGIGWSAVTSQAGYINIWHPFVMIAPSGNLFHFGPTDVMNWVDPNGSGSLTPSGQNVPGSHYPKESCWAMFDEGKILVAGGGANTNPNPNDSSTGTSTNIAYTVNLNGPTPVIAPAAPMQFTRQFANSVVLPSGEVMVIGGNTSGLKFNDTGSILTPEVWNPRTGTWRSLANASVPRNYHSLALLLPDGRVWSGGSGLGGNSADHQNAQIFTPPALFNPDGTLATRPTITSGPTRIGYGVRFTVQATPGMAKFAFIKMSSQTHSVNTDLRYLELPFTETAAGTYEINSRSNINVMTPGYWMLFALNPQSVHSVAKIIQVTNENPASVTNPGNQTSYVGAIVSLQVQVSNPGGLPLIYSATGLPPGLSISDTSGVISGTPTTTGIYNVTVTAGAASVSFQWTIQNGLTLLPLQGPPRASGTVINLTGQSVGGTNTRYQWSFGDGSLDTDFSPTPDVSHAFPGPGRYLVTLTATDDTGRIVTSSYFQAIHAPLTALKPSVSGSIAYETRATGNARIWVVNPDNDTVSVFDAVTRAKLAETPVGAAPRAVAIAPDGRAWVTCADAAVIPILSNSTFAVAQTITLPRGSRPFGIAFDPTGGNAWVTLEAAGQVLRLDPVTGAQTASIAAGANVRHLSVTADGARVYVSRFITPRISGEETAVIDTTNQGGQVLVIDSAALAITQTIILRHSDAFDTAISGRGIPNYLGAPAISPDGLSAWVPSKQDNIKRGMLRNGQGLTHESAVRAIASRIDLATQLEDYPSRVDFDNAGVPSAVCFDPWGIYAFTALEASRAVAVVDVWSGIEVVRFPAGRAPQGLTISPDGRTLFVHNFMDRTVTMHDVSAIVNGAELPAPTTATLTCVATEKLSAQVLLGKQHFYDAKDNRLALQEYLSCAACHNDGGQDGRVWDFTGIGEGLRNTITLRGHGAQGALHWTGNFDEVQDFENQIRNFAGGLGLISGTPNPPLGAPNAGRSADLDALAAYVTSLTASGASPARSTNATLPPAAIAGRSTFKALNCAGCHGGTGFTNSALNVFRDIGTIKPSSGQRLGGPLTGFDVSTLRGVWATAPYLHDGSSATLADAVRAHSGVTLSDPDLNNLVAYLNNIDDNVTSAPALVTVALSTANPNVSGPFTVTANFSGPVTALSLSGIAVSNGSASSLAGNGAAYTFTVSPSAAGPVSVSIAANQAADSDGDGNLASNTLTANYNRPPSIIPPGTQASAAGQIVALQIQASEPDGQPLAFTATGLPAGLFINASSGLISGTVSTLALPTNNATVTASDGLLAVTASFGWNISGVTTLPAAWTGTDIGAPGIAGTASYSAGVYTLKGGGGDIWNSSDQFQFTWRQFTGNGEIIARVSSQTNTDPWAKAGVMFRETLQANSRHAMMVLTPGNGTAFQSRATTGGTSVHVGSTSNPAPNNWVRLVRNGNTFAGYRSADGVTWTQVGSTTIPMATVINVGLAVTAHNNAQLSTATFDNVQVNPSTLPAPWVGNDIGSPKLTDIERFASGAYKVSGGGADIASSSDQFHYVSRSLTGDGQIIARVSSQTNTNGWAKAGVMFRESLQANSRNAAMFLTPSNGFAWQRRTSAGGSTSRTTASRYTAPNNWVRIVRQGNTFTGYRSTNGVNWSQVGTATISMPSTVTVGLAVTARDNAKISDATFDNVQVIP